jgi:hypothetical protein
MLFEIEHLHFQGHSHVKMSTEASGIDLQNQTDVVTNMGKSGFYIFQIWHKNRDINTYLYDLDNNIFYDKKDVLLEIEDGTKTIDDFVLSTAELVCEKKYTPYYNYNGNFTNYANNQYHKPSKTPKDPAYLPGYYGGYGAYDERWDY